MTDAVRMKPAQVVAAWVLGNAALIGLLGAFGELGFAVALYAATAALPTLFAVAVLGADGRNPQPEQAFSLAGAPGAAVWAAGGLFVLGLGSFLGIWLLIIGAVMILGSSYRLVRGSRRPEEVDDRAA